MTDMKDNELKQLEEENDVILAMMKRQAAKDNESLEVPAMEWHDNLVPAGKRGIAPYWLAAAMLAGFLLGIAVPGRNADNNGYSSVVVNTQDSCRSLMENDVNLALLVSI